jgi:sigma-54 specific flagellar transcriptional regulator A
MQAVFGDSPAINQLQQLLKACAGSDASVLVQGETGTGKEVVCWELHKRSNRADFPFVALNCAAIPVALLESELFGYRKGAYTGATTDRKGRLELAHRGTLMLDEIGDMPLELQAKLLRFLEDRMVEPLGGNGEGTQVDVRVLAATHKDLNLLVSEGKFREDLFYRLNVVPLQVPALRERQQELPMFCRHFARLHAKGKPEISFTQRSLEIFSLYRWPGNVRELSNLVMRLTVLFPGQQIDLLQVPSSLLGPGLKQTLTDHGGASYTEPSGPVEFLPSSDLNVLDFFDAEQFTESDLQEPIPAKDLVEWVSEHLKQAVVLPEGGLQAKEMLEKFEKGLIYAALRQAANNTQASKLLGMERTTFIQKLTRFGIDPKAVK